MLLSPEEKFVESIAGVVPEHPLQYTLELLRHDRIECSKHTGYSPAATSWMMSSAREFRDLKSRIGFFQQKCIDIQMGVDKMRDFEKEEIEILRGEVAQKRADDIEYALMMRDHAREKLDEAVQCDWKKHIPYRAAILLELEGYLPTFEQMKEKYLTESAGSELSTGERELVKSDYHSTVVQIIEEHLGTEYLGDGVRMEKLVSFVQDIKKEWYGEFRDMLRSKAIDIFKKGESTESINEEEGRILAFYISGGETGDLYAINEHTLSRTILPGPRKLTRQMIKTWLPREQLVVA